MGLEQKRIVNEFQTDVFPNWKKNLDTIVGFDLPVEVKWDTLISDDYSNKGQYFEWYNNVYFKPLALSFEKICKDQMGKEAVKENVKKVVINGAQGTHPTSSKYEDGIFYVNHLFHTNVDDVQDRADGWKNLIEAKLS